MWIATDPDHTARAVILARIALGSQGIRDVLRLTLWRATGSTGAWLAPQVVARKRADCLL
ncbi:hypothetical protein [Synechococcus lacustris]|uniref:hypothetical protein n=1 Tax=Synechococcus lacustris TaxID=2116544 RepID=UPI0020CB8317|nr:hypothetical protein [Synechococcus lacustris]MCP9795655.1 hypothetical protein [Synechococcus lacustris L1F-Slac]